MARRARRQCGRPTQVVRQMTRRGDFMERSLARHVVRLEPGQPVWDRIFTVAPLVLVGTKEAAGGYDLAPKHMAFQLGWENYFGFVCTPRHRTYHNVIREGVFTVSYPRPNQVVLACLAAAPRCPEEEVKAHLAVLSTTPAQAVDGVFLSDSYLFLECALERVVDGFGENSLVTGRIVAAHADHRILRGNDRDDNDLIHHAPLLAYLHPGRFARIRKSFSFPFPDGFQK